MHQATRRAQLADGAASDRLLSEVAHARGGMTVAALASTLDTGTLIQEVAAIRYQDILERARDLYHAKAKERSGKIRTALASEFESVRLAGALAQDWLNHDAARSKEKRAAKAAARKRDQGLRGRSGRSGSRKRQMVDSTSTT